MKNFYREIRQNKKKIRNCVKKCEASSKIKKNKNEISSFNKCDKKYTFDDKFIIKTIINRITSFENCRNFK